MTNSRCTAVVRQGDDWQVCDAPTDGRLCSKCGRQLERWIGDLPALLGHLDESVARQTRVDRTPVSYDHPPPDWADEQRAIPARLRSILGDFALVANPLPVDLDAAALLAEVRAGMVRVYWGLQGIEVVTKPGSVGGRSFGGTYQDMAIAAWLTEHIDDIRVSEDGPAIHRDVERWTSKIMRAIDTRQPDIYAGRCDLSSLAFDYATIHGPVCHGWQFDDRTWCDHWSCGVIRRRQYLISSKEGICGVDLYARPGESTVSCRACGTEYELSERRERIVESVYDRLATATEIAILLTRNMQPVTSSSIRQMAYGGRLEQRGMAADGKSVLYNVGDVVTILRQRAEAAAEKEAKEHQKQQRAKVRA